MSPLLVSIVLTIAASSAMAIAAVYLRLPGGAIVWALAAAAALHMARPDLDALPSEFRTAAQILVGTVLGTSISRSPLRALWQVRRTVAVFIVVLVATCLGAAYLLAMITPLSLTTATFGIAPGGASDMATASLHFGADGALVAGLQVVRQLLVFVLVPALFAMFFRADPPGQNEEQDS